MTVHELTRVDARRIAVRAQLLDGARPAGLLDVVRHLTLLQIDPTAAIAPSADLVAWSRLGSPYSPAELDTALEDRALLVPWHEEFPREVVVRAERDLAAGGAVRYAALRDGVIVGGASFRLERGAARPQRAAVARGPERGDQGRSE